MIEFEKKLEEFTKIEEKFLNNLFLSNNFFLKVCRSKYTSNVFNTINKLDTQL